MANPTHARHSPNSPWLLVFIGLVAFIIGIGLIAAAIGHWQTGAGIAFVIFVIGLLGLAYNRSK